MLLYEMPILVPKVYGVDSILALVNLKRKKSLALVAKKKVNLAL